MLDAPALQDDFYLNLVDWSSQNVLAVGLGTCVYLWSACTSKASGLLHEVATAKVVRVRTGVEGQGRGQGQQGSLGGTDVRLWRQHACGSAAWPCHFNTPCTSSLGLAVK